MKFFKKIIFIGSLVVLFSTTFATTVDYVSSNMTEEEKNGIQRNKIIFKKDDKEDNKVDSLKIEQKENINNSNENLDSILNIHDSNENLSINNNTDTHTYIKNKNDNFIFIGDSRTVAMSKLVDISKYEFVTFIAKSSQGFKWFSTEGLAKLEKRLNTTNLNYNIILNLGVNDLHNVNKYAKLYNSLKEKYSQHNFFVASVNPTDEVKMKKYNYTATNQLIKQFNDKLSSSLSKNIIYIDSFKHLQENGFNTTDGLHYTNESSIEILDYISNIIKNL